MIIIWKPVENLKYNIWSTSLELQIKSVNLRKGKKSLRQEMYHESSLSEKISTTLKQPYTAAND